MLFVPCAVAASAVSGDKWKISFNPLITTTRRQAFAFAATARNPDNSHAKMERLPLVPFNCLTPFIIKENWGEFLFIESCTLEPFLSSTWNVGWWKISLEINRGEIDTSLVRCAKASPVFKRVKSHAPFSKNPADFSSKLWKVSTFCIFSRSDFTARMKFSGAWNSDLRRPDRRTSS